MKVIIAGSRDFTNRHVVAQALNDSGFIPTQIVSGGARGVDTVGENIALLMGYSVKQFPADWETYGKAAGPIRNAQMAEYADALIAIWDGESRGTKNMIDTMQKLGKPVHIHMILK